MCGIYGFVGLRADHRAGLDAIRRRGPDDAGDWADPALDLWLGHRRLSILDLSSAGHQPMLSPDDRVVMIYNGEIYNYLELRAELEAAGETFVGHSDSEVLLRLFAREGEACFRRLNGIFAAAFWDRAGRTLTLVRDPMGIKPLYLAHKDGGIAFASEMKALVRSGTVDPKVNPSALLRHLGLLWSPGTETIVEGVEKLEPGELLTFSPGGRVERRFYADPMRPKERYEAIGADEAAAKVRDTIEAAVERQLITDVPVGAFLSGGLDSSSVVAFATRHFAGRLQCFSIDTEGEGEAEGFSDDLPYARRVADHLGVDLHVVRTDRRMMDRLPEMLYHLDEPTADPAALNALLISELARSQGMKVLLSGAGGDDVFTGYRRHYALQQERWWSWWPQPVRAGLRAAAGALPRRHPLARRVAKAFEGADRPAAERLARYFLWLDPSRVLGLLSPDLRAGLVAGDTYAPLERTVARAGGRASLETMLYLENKHFLADHNLNYTDKMGMAAGVEVRVPLLDLKVVELANSLPTSLRQRGRTGKWIFKKAMEPILPHDVIYRPKSGFGVPLRRWLATSMREVAEDTLGADAVRRRGLFDADAVQRLRADDAAGRIDASYTIFALMCAELWARQYLDGRWAVDANPERSAELACVK